MSRVFQRTGQVTPRRSMFDLSYSKLLTGDLGKLYPVLCDEVVPGDYWQIGNEVVLRFNPLLAPILHRIDCVTHYFFVPYRILDENWEDFITGGKYGDNDYTLPRFDDDVNTDSYTKGSLWDYFGFPLGDGTQKKISLVFCRLLIRGGHIIKFGMNTTAMRICKVRDLFIQLAYVS